MCNLGPLAPTPQSCLNCGMDHDDGEDCPGCGLSKAAAHAFLDLPAEPAPDAARVAEEAFKRGLFRHGLAVLNRRLQDDFSDTAAWDLKYRLLQSLGFLDANQAMLEQALARGAPPILFARYGSVLASRGAHAEAAEAFRQCLERCPDDPLTVAFVSSSRGNSLAAMGDFAGAEEAHRRAINACPDYAPLYLNFADTVIKQHRWDEAVEVLDLGLRRARAVPERIELLEAKGHALAGQMKGNEALACVDEAVALGSNSVKTHYIRGRALAMIGRLQEAQRAMEQVLRLDPNMIHARQALQQISAALKG
jgi:tetratricopeptide (TPR) repeat protein